MEGVEEWNTALLSLPCGKTQFPVLEMLENGEERAPPDRPLDVFIYFRTQSWNVMFYEDMAASVFSGHLSKDPAKGKSMGRINGRVEMVVRAEKSCPKSERKPCDKAGTIWPRTEKFKERLWFFLPDLWSDNVHLCYSLSAVTNTLAA